MYDTFKDSGTHDSIKNLLNHKDTQCIMIDNDSGLEKSTLLACVLFSTIDVTPGDAFVQYVVTCERCIIPDIMVHAKENNLGSICKHGLCKKLLQLVQYVAWVHVQNVTLYLTCTNALQPFYEK